MRWTFPLIADTGPDLFSKIDLTSPIILHIVVPPNKEQGIIQCRSILEKWRRRL
ncbi:MAG: hypothetical protein ABIH23_26900 [bacterium]